MRGRIGSRYQTCEDGQKEPTDVNVYQVLTEITPFFKQTAEQIKFGPTKLAPLHQLKLSRRECCLFSEGFHESCRGFFYKSVRRMRGRLRWRFPETPHGLTASTTSTQS
jgi:hypothetical protein